MHNITFYVNVHLEQDIIKLGFDGGGNTLEASAASSSAPKDLRPFGIPTGELLELRNKLVSASLVKTPSEFPGKKNKRKIRKNQARLIFPDFSLVQRCALRTARPAKLALSGNGGSR